MQLILQANSINIVSIQLDQDVSDTVNTMVNEHSKEYFSPMKNHSVR